MALTREQYVDKIKRKLGWPAVAIEIKDEHIASCVDEAFETIQQYITDSKFVTLPYANKTDMTQYDVDHVVEVFKGTLPKEYDITCGVPFTGEIFIDGNVTSIADVFDRDDISRLSVSYLRRQIAATIKNPISYKFIKPYLYVDMGYPVTEKMTVEYVPNYKSVTDIDSKYWINILYRLALANTKEVLGRVRSKVRVSGAPFELDGNTLLSEGREEADKIISKLEEQAYDFYSID